MEKKAASFIETLADQAVQALTTPGIDRGERITRFRKLFNERFAVSGIARWVLGRYWSTATPDQQKEYLRLFEDMVVASYVDRFTDYSGEKLKIRQTTAIDDQYVSVGTEIDRPSGPPVQVGWRVGRSDDTFKVVDVVVEGTSMSTTMRSDFSSIIRQNGGEIEGLLSELRHKTESLNASPKS